MSEVLVPNDSSTGSTSTLQIAQESIDDEAPIPTREKILFCSQTFVARLEGQVTVFEEEPVFLLDDSHPFWWLVRLVKTGEVGFIPGEIADNENERLARLNREKNSKQNLAVRPEELSGSQGVILSPKVEGNSKSTSNLDSPNPRKILVKFDSEIMEKTITAESVTEDDASETDGESLDSLEKMAQESSSDKHESLLKIISKTFQRRKNSITLGYDKHGEQGVHVLRIFPTKSCKTTVLYKTVLVSLKLTIEDIVEDFIKRFKWEGSKDDYYISIADIAMARKEDLILDGKALLSDVIDNLMKQAKSQSKGAGGYEMLTKLVPGATVGQGTPPVSVPVNVVSIGSLYGMTHDLPKYKILKNLRFMINKRVDFKAKVNFLFRVYVQGKEDSAVRYTTIDMDNLMKVRDVFNIALRKFGIFPTEGVRHDLILCEKDSDQSVKEIPIKRSEMVETIMNEIVKPTTSGHEFYFLLRQVEKLSDEEDVDGDNATFQAKLSKSPSGEFNLVGETNERLEAMRINESALEHSLDQEHLLSANNTIKKAGSEGSLVSGAKDSIRKKDLNHLRIPKRDSVSSESSDYSFSASTISSTSPAGSQPTSPVHPKEK